jgi:hypothetical protein
MNRGDVDVQVPDASQGVADDSAPDLALGAALEMLELTAAAGIGVVVRTPGVDPGGGSLEHPPEAAAGKRAPARLDVDLDELVGRRARDEDGEPIMERSDPIAPRGDATDPHGLRHRSASRRPVSAQRLGPFRSAATAGFRA